MNSDLPAGNPAASPAMPSPQASSQAQASAPPSTGTSPAPQTGANTSTAPPVSEQSVLLRMIQMMTVQQQAMQQQQHQFQAFLEHQARMQNEIYEKQARATRQKSKAEPPKFNGTAKEDLELWLFQIEEHFSCYALEKDSNDSRFVDMVVPYLGTDVMSWYREFKNTLGETPRTWCVFKQQLRVRFRDSDFEFKLLSRLYDLRATGTQQEYTSKFMLLLSQSSLDLPEMVKRWFYQQNLRSDASTHISQNVPTTLQETIEHAQRFEDARKPVVKKGPSGLLKNGDSKSPVSISDESKKANSSRRHDPEFLKKATCHICGVKGHIAPDCPENGKPRAQKN